LLTFEIRQPKQMMDFSNVGPASGELTTATDSFGKMA